MTMSLRLMPLLALGLWPVTACGTAEERGERPALQAAAEPAPQTGSEPEPEPVPPDERPVQAELLGQGEAIAETLCAGCHAIGLSGESPHPEAVPLRQLSSMYPVEFVAESFAEGIAVGHPDMPQWQFEPEQIDALLAYLESIQVPGEE